MMITAELISSQLKVLKSDRSDLVVLIKLSFCNSFFIVANVAQLTVSLQGSRHYETINRCLQAYFATDGVV